MAPRDRTLVSQTANRAFLRFLTCLGVTEFCSSFEVQRLRTPTQNTKLINQSTYKDGCPPVYTGQTEHHKLTASRMKVVTNDHQWRTSGDDQDSHEFAA